MVLDVELCVLMLLVVASNASGHRLEEQLHSGLTDKMEEVESVPVESVELKTRIARSLGSQGGERSEELCEEVFQNCLNGNDICGCHVCGTLCGDCSSDHGHSGNENFLSYWRCFQLHIQCLTGLDVCGTGICKTHCNLIATATCSKNATKKKISEMKFKDLWKKYPLPKDAGTDEMWKKAGFKNLTGSTCALRISYTMYLLGFKICNKKLLKECNWSTYTNKKGQKYIIRADTWHCYLTKIFKKPLCVKDKKKLKGKKGFITFRHCTFKKNPKHPTGHIDLWDGAKCRNQCYFKKCKEFCLFEMKK